jgi:predicted nucleic acid-binding protein
VKFWDTSALVALSLKEARSTPLRNIAAEDGAIVVWWVTLVECYSAFARLRRDNILTRAQEDQVRQGVARLAAGWTEVQPSHTIRETAARALLLHPLRAADALHLAAGLFWADGRPAGQHFVSLDGRLREAAQREGFDVLP